MEDKHINLEGFLEGNEQAPLVWSKLELNSDLTDTEWLSIRHYKIRAREFLQNLEDLKLPRVYSLTIDSSNDIKSVITNLYPGRHRAKSIYLDFRHFIADKEPSKFELVVNIIKSHIDHDHLMQSYLKSLKRSFLQQQNDNITLNGKVLSANKIVNLWFNTEFFHAGDEYQNIDRMEILKSIEYEGGQNILFWSVITSQNHIKHLYACLKDLEENKCLYINCPDARIIQKVTNSR